jgi:hypothetical protein
LFRKLNRIETEPGNFCPKTTPKLIKLGATVAPLQQIDTCWCRDCLRGRHPILCAMALATWLSDWLTCGSFANSSQKDFAAARARGPAKVTSSPNGS